MSDSARDGSPKFCGFSELAYSLKLWVSNKGGAWLVAEYFIRETGPYFVKVSHR
jgi:hypothetical protein